jgi:NAD+ synthase (glutamine-hydrolysing)
METKNKRDRELVPRNTILRAPTAELRANQKDQDTLPDYEVLDKILRMAVEGGMNAQQIEAQGFEGSVVRDVVRMIQRNEYKRRQAAPGLKISSRAFGTGWRMPLAMRLNF